MYIADHVVEQIRTITAPGYWIATGEEGGMKKLVDITETRSNRVSYNANEFMRLASGNDFIGILRAVREDVGARADYDTTLAHFGLKTSEERSRGDHELIYIRLDARETQPKIAGWLCLPEMLPLPSNHRVKRWSGKVVFTDWPLDDINARLSKPVEEMLKEPAEA